ncbi:MAG: SDR family oxidoreductase [Pseudomonadota bacterium]
MGALDGKIALVTGATKGIGFATARQLASEGARVLLHARDSESGSTAIEELQSAVPDAAFELVAADVSTVSGTRALAASVLEKAPHLDILINNVGAMYNDLTHSDDGIETTFAVNHLSIFLLTHLLLERMQSSAPARIITIASEIHRKATINFDDVNLSEGYGASAALGQSKLANILFTRALAKRIEGTGVEAYSLHPGHVRTAFTRDIKGWFKIFIKVISLRFLSPDQGAACGVYLATAPSLENANGNYFIDCKPIAPSDYALNDQIAERLWTLSEQMTGLTGAQGH